MQFSPDPELRTLISVNRKYASFDVSQSPDTAHRPHFDNLHNIVRGFDMYKRIIVPVDGSTTSNRALTAALQLARETGGQVRLLFVVEEMAYLGGYDQFGGYSGDVARIVRESGQKVLTDSMAIAAAAGVQADHVLFDTFRQRLGEVVADAAKAWNADLVVVGTHGRRGIGRVLMGSGAEEIIRMAPVPVLVIRARDEAGQS
jgi:nucleotide-binding universal stress UspA family protein